VKNMVSISKVCLVLLILAEFNVSIAEVQSDRYFVAGPSETILSENGIRVRFESEVVGNKKTNNFIYTLQVTNESNQNILISWEVLDVFLAKETGVPFLLSLDAKKSRKFLLVNNLSPIEKTGSLNVFKISENGLFNSAVDDEAVGFVPGKWLIEPEPFGK